MHLSRLLVSDSRLLLELVLGEPRLHLAVELLGDLLAVETDLVPGQVKELVDTFERAASSFGDAKPNPNSANNGDGREEVEGTGGAEALAVEEHDGSGLVGGVLADEVHGHGDGGADGTDAEGEQLGRQKVLAGVPAKSPSYAGNVDHGDSAGASSGLGCGGLVTVDFGDGYDVEEDGDVQHSDGLEDDADDQGALATKSINEEQCADDGGDELDDTEDSSAEERRVLASDTNDLEQIVGVDGDGRSTRPAGEELCEVGEEQTV